VFSETAEFYDLIYDRFRDYPEDTERVARAIRRYAPQARTILDVGCGTGRHAQLLADEHGYEVDGLDIQPEFVEIARGRCPQGRFSVGDMADFDLGKRYDVVLSLFSSIAYVRTLVRLASAARALSRHLAPGGLSMVEPWMTPEDFTPGRVYLQCADTDEVKISRMSSSHVRNGVSILDFHYLVGSSQEVRHLRETHELGLFSKEEMRSAMEAGGLKLLEFDPEGLMGRGLYILQNGTLE